MRVFTEVHLRKIKDKLDLLERYHNELVEDLPDYSDFVEERLTRRGIEKTIELIADGIVDVLMILISVKGLEKPKEAAETARILAIHKVLSSSLAVKIQNLIRFRNLLVHQYAKVDDVKEYAVLAENHNDIIEFISAIEQFLKKEFVDLKKKV